MPHIAGERIVLREYQLTDLSYMRQWVNDPEITNGLSDILLFPHTSYSTESYLKMMIEGSTEIKGFIIADKDSKEYVGQIDLHKIDWKNRNAVMGIVIGRKEYLGKGYGSEAIRMLQDFVFQSLNLNRLELEVYEYNERAYRCYLKCGFKEEGRLRKKLYKNGKYWDIICMSILRSEYESD
ncbi:GNAT family N-acetyltransferase [Paenibacillus sp. J14]|uniref:GNAT family N-acetyltransferase n=1 Tax=Paenibacillus sp. (strain J14) TaxID=935845 RepID=UPI00048D1901|nr:GNAT family protein [Paenibacillus sp. J14]